MFVTSSVMVMACVAVAVGCGAAAVQQAGRNQKRGQRGHPEFCPPEKLLHRYIAIATSLHCYIATSLHCYIHRYIATLLHDCYTRPNLSKSIILKYGASVKSIEIHLPTLLHCYIATYISTSLHRYTLLHRYIAISLHCYISGRIFRLPPFFELSGFFPPRARWTMTHYNFEAKSRM